MITSAMAEDRGLAVNTRPQVVPPLGEAAEAPLSLDSYLDSLVHGWCRILTALGFTLIPAFYALDIFMMPQELLPRFAMYRIVTTAIVLAQFFVVLKTSPGRYSYLHGYFFSLVVGTSITVMTTDLGGFHSTYYAGLNLVMIAVNQLLPWHPLHAACTSALTIGMYILFNVAVPQSAPLEVPLLVNNLYFLVSTAVIAVSINAVKHQLIVKEFLARGQLEEARDALWGEMEVAKHIQTALLPQVSRVGAYQVAALMQPADEVGGDYYDVIETEAGEGWLAVGDVSGHGVESGLVMMMVQTSLLTTVSLSPGLQPSSVLTRVNRVLGENVRRLGTDRYMTITALRLDDDRVRFAGLHQDLLIHRARTNTVEVVQTSGTWLGIVDDLDGVLADAELRLDVGDTLLLYTDGVTEAQDASGRMFGEARLRAVFNRLVHLSPPDLVHRVADEVGKFTSEQQDDVSVIAVRRLTQRAPSLEPGPAPRQRPA